MRGWKRLPHPRPAVAADRQLIDHLHTIRYSSVDQRISDAGDVNACAARVKPEHTTYLLINGFREGVEA